MKKFFVLMVVSIALNFGGLQNLYAVQRSADDLKETCIQSMQAVLLSLAGSLNGLSQEEIFETIVKQAACDLSYVPDWKEIMVYDHTLFAGTAQEQFRDCLAILCKKLEEPK